MGLIQSKVDTYVLRVEESEPKYTPTIKPRVGANRNTTVVPALSSLTLLDSPLGSIEREIVDDDRKTLGTKPMTKQSSTLTGQFQREISSLSPNNLPTNKQGSQKQSSQLAKQSSQLIKQVSVLPANTENNATTATSTKQSGKRLSQQQSGLLPVDIQPIKTSHKNTGMKCSSEYSWLLKKANLTGIQLQDIEFGRIIGRGLMGTARVCKIKNQQKYFVMKSLRKDYIVKHNDQRHVNNEKEILTLMLLHSQSNPASNFCVKLFGTFQDRNHIYFGLEYVPGGELFHRLGKKTSFPPAVAKFYATEIFCALDYIHSIGYVYRDLKPENVILDEEGHCKLVDFGFAMACRPEDRLKTMCGTPAYLSPEQLDGKLTNGYTKVVDWWSFGVLIYELNTGKTPFCKSNSESHYEIFLRILNSKISYPLRFDSKSKELISRLCHANLDKRLAEKEEIKQHPYFEIPWEAVGQRRLVPPFIPRLKDEGDSHYFDRYHDNNQGLPNSTSDEINHTVKEFFDF
jgi:tRNA A-37 threonylcarbamoyl transferase component Bud32